MSDDIVTRLREGEQWHRKGYIEVPSGFYDFLADQIESERAKAADEIERLRNKLAEQELVHAVQKTNTVNEIERLRLDRDRWRLASITFANMAEDNGVSSREIYQSIWETVKKGSAQ